MLSKWNDSSVKRIFDMLNEIVRKGPFIFPVSRRVGWIRLGGSVEVT